MAIINWIFDSQWRVDEAPEHEAHSGNGQED